MKDRVAIPGQSVNPLLVIGSVAYDGVITPYAERDRILGGAAAYAALAASYFTDTRIVGVVGEDFADSDRKRLEDHGIDISGLEMVPGTKTFYWKGRYAEHFKSRETLELQLNVFENFEPKLPENFTDTPFVLLGNIDPEIQMQVLNQIQSSADPFILADTIDFWIHSKKDALIELMQKVSLFVVDASEALLLTEEHNIVKAGQKLSTMGPKMVIVKKGEHGAMLFHPEGVFAMPAFPVEQVNDPTGAGDSFAGSLMGYLASQGKTDLATFKQAMLYATIVGGLTVEAFSCDRLEAAGPKEIEQRKEELVKMISL